MAPNFFESAYPILIDKSSQKNQFWHKNLASPKYLTYRTVLNCQIGCWCFLYKAFQYNVTDSTHHLAAIFNLNFDYPIF